MASTAGEVAPGRNARVGPPLSASGPSSRAGVATVPQVVSDTRSNDVVGTSPRQPATGSLTMLPRTDELELVHTAEPVADVMLPAMVEARSVSAPDTRADALLGSVAVLPLKVDWST